MARNPMPMSPSRICFIAAAVCFALTLFAIGAFNWTALGLLLLAVGLAI